MEFYATSHRHTGCVPCSRSSIQSSQHPPRAITSTSRRNGQPPTQHTHARVPGRARPFPNMRAPPPPQPLPPPPPSPGLDGGLSEPRVSAVPQLRVDHVTRSKAKQGSSRAHHDASMAHVHSTGNSRCHTFAVSGALGTRRRVGGLQAPRARLAPGGPHHEVWPKSTAAARACARRSESINGWPWRHAQSRPAGGDGGWEIGRRRRVEVSTTIGVGSVGRACRVRRVVATCQHTVSILTFFLMATELYR
jgi:hypothetical protein